MTAVKDFFASVRIAVDNFYYYYGHIVWIAIGAALLILAVVLLVRSERCRAYGHERYTYTEPDTGVRERAAKNLSDAIRYETVTGDTEAMEKFRSFLAARYPLVFSRLSVDVMREGSLLIYWEGEKTGRKPVLFAAHQDVVPAGSGWTAEPFAGERQNGRIWGRGTIDCKNTLIALLEAAEALLSQDFKPKRDIYFAFGSDEETGGKNGAVKIARILDKRGVHLAMALDEGGFITNGFAGNRYGVAAQVGVAEKGCCTVHISAESAGGHASNPPAHTAAGTVSEAICRAESVRFKPRCIPLTKEFLKLAAGQMDAPQRFICANMTGKGRIAARLLAKNAFFSPMLRTTAAATVIKGGSAPNALPAEAHALLNIRLLQGDTSESIAKVIAERVSDLPCHVEVMQGGREPSKISDYKGEMFETLEKTVKERYGDIPVLPSLFSAATDGYNYESISDCVFRFSPFVLSQQEISRMHGADERISENCLGAGAEFYEMLIKRLA